MLTISLIFSLASFRAAIAEGCDGIESGTSASVCITKSYLLNAFDRCSCHIGRCYPHVSRPHIGPNDQWNGFDQESAMEGSHWVGSKVGVRCRWLKMISRHVRTTKEPVQPIPLFEQLISLLMEVSRLIECHHLWLMWRQPQNRHVSLNVGFSSPFYLDLTKLARSTARCRMILIDSL